MTNHERIAQAEEQTQMRMEYYAMEERVAALEDERYRLRAAVNTALMHMIGYVNPTDAERELIAVLRKAVLQEVSDDE